MADTTGDRRTVIEILEDGIRFSESAGRSIVPFSIECVQRIIELLKEQQQKKIKLLERLDENIKWAEEARKDSECNGNDALVEHYKIEESLYEHAKSIVKHTL